MRCWDSWRYYGRGGLDIRYALVPGDQRSGLRLMRQAPGRSRSALSSTLRNMRRRTFLVALARQARLELSGRETQDTIGAAQAEALLVLQRDIAHDLGIRLIQPGMGHTLVGAAVASPRHLAVGRHHCAATAQRPSPA